jgi:hypothetical protein
MADKPDRKLVQTYGDQVETRRQTFLDNRGILPVGTLTIFAGRGGEGKTTLALDYVARVTRGTLEGDLKGKPRTVLIVSHEDDLSTQLVPRLIAAGAKLNNVVFIKVATTYKDVDVLDVPSLVEDQALLQQAIDENNPALIVIDPLTSSIDGDTNKLQDVRRSLQPLTALLQKNELSCIGIAHQNKGAGGYAGDRVSGSHAFRDVARSLVLFATDNETGDRVFTVDKSSYGNVAGTSYGFRLVSVSVPVDEGGETSAARVEHLGASSMSVSDLWARDREPADSGRTDAMAWLEDYLESVGGSARAKEIVAAGALAGISERTLQDAGKRRKVGKSRDGKNGPFVWTLRPVPAVPAVPADARGVAPTAPTAPTHGDEGPL